MTSSQEEELPAASTGALWSAMRIWKRDILTLIELLVLDRLCLPHLDADHCVSRRSIALDRHEHEACGR